MEHDPYAAALSKILNAEKAAKQEVMIRPATKLLKKTFDILKENNFIGGYEEVKDGKGNIIKVNLNGNINKCLAIKPRFPITKEDYENYEKRFLIAKDFGFLILSTPKGLMTNKEAKEKGIGGKLIAYVY
jgi:small subunit ribosomal protein S8